ncbi:MAG: MoxR family ATPase [Chlamydiia bacterium]|nr:MoxR family ATPase [Chlamydiia bacterium]
MSYADVKEIEAHVKKQSVPFHSAKRALHEVIVGQETLINRLLIGLLAEGHLLLEGLPGLAKTLAMVSLSQIIACQYSRIQFTPDLLPADLIGTTLYHPQTATFSVKKGPLFSHLILADEINRAPGKVQSALLEAMQERQITIGDETFPLERPYLVVATQNPVEHEGTYPLPEAQIDRFLMKVRIDYPDRDEEKEIIRRFGGIHSPARLEPVVTREQIASARSVIDAIYIDEKIVQYILDIVLSTRTSQTKGSPIEGMLEFGASPRATLAFVSCAKAHAFLEGRGYVTPHDVKSLAHDILRHRIRLTYGALAEGMTPERLIDQILNSLIVP